MSYAYSGTSGLSTAPSLLPYPRASAGGCERLLAASLGAFARSMTNLRILDCGGVLDVDPNRPRVYVANHASHADFLVLWAALPQAIRFRTRPVGGMDYWMLSPIRRYFAERVFHAVLIRRHDIDRWHNPLSAMVDALRGGESLILFPEGTRGDGAVVGPFRSGIYHLLQSAPETEIIPVWIDNLQRALPRGAMLPIPLECSVVFGSPLTCAEEPKAAFLGRLRAAVMRLEGACQR